MRRLTFSVLIAASSTAAMASPSYSDIGSYGGYVTALAGYGTINSYFLGDNLENVRVEAAKHNADWQFFTTGSASAEADYSDSTLTGHGSATGDLGVFHLDGSASGLNSTFRYGGGSGGWSDTWTINKAGLAGTKGTLQFSVLVDGQISATGATGAAGFGVEEYVNGVHGPSANYQVTTVQGSPSMTVNDAPTFEASFTYGQAFTLGIFLEAYGESRAEGGPIALSSATADFTNTATWNGISGVLDASNNSVSGYTITTASGTNWQGAATPEPAPLLALGVGVLALLRRRRG